ncbi:MAG: BrnT family toxin [Bryobacterales bacterium]|nr:BrnT family toxin [Bryobacterales bacterium]
MELTFEWDPRKERANLEKHSINFSEAMAVFDDSLARIFADEDHSADERREIIVGQSQAKRLLLVSFTEPDQGRIRIISARRATRRERRDYEEYLKR